MHRNNLLFIFFVTFSFVSCSQNYELKYIKKFTIKVPEPSGLTYADGYLYAVSDNHNRIFKLATDGKLIESFTLPIRDLEGITYHPSHKVFYLVSESNRAIYSYNPATDELERYFVKGNQNGGGNKGLEGVAYSPKKQALYLVNERKPKKLLKLTLDGKILKKHNLKFGDDISGLCYDPFTKHMWALSDQSKAVYLIKHKGKKIQKYDLPIKAPEGIAIDNTGLMYIVSDKTSEVIVYQIKKSLL